MIPFNESRLRETNVLLRKLTEEQQHALFILAIVLDNLSVIYIALLPATAAAFQGSPQTARLLCIQQLIAHRSDGQPHLERIIVTPVNVVVVTLLA